ncbi:Tetratricopeptide repeat (TPR)-like superfamily protein [Hibiscus syriacus]|uniref:Tetratricopeptide repeat (TPR)-like superfamily protein n=1 Tax=Hibiscus syriacus TaxID=106335 RepID=A0A6A3BAP6_HIBSY|nr:Tetratricopeptide repeat (TPR)-like superfamily protein [Hibiscus syriacus]
MEEIQDLRNCYDPNEIEDYDDEKLAWMLFIDGCAVLCAVHYGMKGDFQKLNTKANLLVFAQLDFFLLENQIPYRVLRILIDSAIEPQKWKQSITDFINRNLMTNIHHDEHKSQMNATKGREDYAHLLERLRKELLTGDDEKDKQHSNMIGRMLLRCGDGRKHRIRKTFRSIKDLKESGIHVEPNKTNSLKNISFYCRFLGKITMPRLLVDDSTAAMFMNLIALEMCRPVGTSTTSLRDEEVADLFNKISRDLVPDQDKYSGVVNDIHRFCNNIWTPAVAQVYYSHFSSPWTFLALLGAIISLLFSATRAYLSLPGNRPENERNP